MRTITRTPSRIVFSIALVLAITPYATPAPQERNACGVLIFLPATCEGESPGATYLVATPEEGLWIEACLTSGSELTVTVEDALLHGVAVTTDDCVWFGYWRSIVAFPWTISVEADGHFTIHVTRFSGF